jgi:osmotically-inducible protein OsmY
MVREAKPKNATETRTDEEIRGHIVEQLQWDERVDSRAVTVEVRHGDVVLSGTVATYGAQRAAAESARCVLGVQHVHNRVTVLYPNHTTAPKDSDIRLDAINTLSWSPNIDTSDVEVSVEKGVVILDGSVDTYPQKIQAEELIATLAGVREVKNNLRVQPAVDLIDEAIARDIASTLRNDPLVDAGQIVVDVNDGVVTLSGTVPNAEANLTALQIARNTRGVLEVISKLGVGRPQAST